jgi:hypothetical protein
MVYLVGFTAQTEQQDRGEVRVGRIAGEDTTEEIGGFAVLSHAAAGAVGYGDDAIDIGIGAQYLGGEVGSDAAGYCRRAVNCGENAYIVTGSDAAVGPDNALKGGSFGRPQELGWVGL